MTVQELIAELAKYNPESVVVFQREDMDEYYLADVGEILLKPFGKSSPNCFREATERTVTHRAVIIR